MNLAHGGHLTHGLSVNFSGRTYHFHHYGVDRETGRIDMDEVRAQAQRTKPKLIVAGASAYARIIDFAAFRAIADEVGAELMVDMAHIAGLVAAGVHPSPFPHSQWVTTTTHKTLAGPRGGAAFCLRQDAKRSGQVGLPRTAGRAAGARDRGQGGVLLAGRHRGLQDEAARRPWRTRAYWPTR